MAKLTQLDAELAAAFRDSEIKHASAAEKAFKLKSLSAEKTGFQAGIKELENWMLSLNLKSQVGQNLSQNVEKLKTLLTQIGDGVLKSEKLSVEYLNIKSVKASALEIEELRAQLEAQSRINIRNIQQANALFSEKISGHVFGVGYRAHLSEKQAVLASKGNLLQRAKAVRVGAALGVASAVVEGAIPSVVLGGISDMTEQAIRSLTSTEEILNVKNDPKFICSAILDSKESQKEFNKNLSRLKAARYRDEGKIEKISAAQERKSTKPSAGVQ